MSEADVYALSVAAAKLFAVALCWVVLRSVV